MLSLPIVGRSPTGRRGMSKYNSAIRENQLTNIKIESNGDLGKLMEPTHLVSNTGSPIVFSGCPVHNKEGQDKKTKRLFPQERKKKRNIGLRRLSRLSRGNSTRKVGITNSYNVQQGQFNSTKSCSVDGSSTIDAIIDSHLASLFSVVKSKSSRQAFTEKEESIQDSPQLKEPTNHINRENNSPTSLVEAIVGSGIIHLREIRERKEIEATKIQALVRRFLCQIDQRKKLLKKKLELIKQQKEEDLAKIKAFKQKAICSFQACLEGENRRMEKRWHQQRETIGALIPLLRAVREENAKLKIEHSQLQAENRQLVKTNTRVLQSIAREDWRLNHSERCEIGLIHVSGRYKAALNLGKSLLEKLDEDSGFSVAQKSLTEVLKW